MRSLAVVGLRTGGRVFESLRAALVSLQLFGSDGLDRGGGGVLRCGMAIIVRQTSKGDPMEFEVEVREGGGHTRHHVTMSQTTYTALAGNRDPETFIRAAFAFLLDREAKESILSRFDVTVIGRYFPEFEREIGRYH